MAQACKGNQSLRLEECSVVFFWGCPLTSPSSGGLNHMGSQRGPVVLWGCRLYFLYRALQTQRRFLLISNLPEESIQIPPWTYVPLDSLTAVARLSVHARGLLALHAEICFKVGARFGAQDLTPNHVGIPGWGFLNYRPSGHKV